MTNSQANAPPSTHRDILVIAASSGGIKALKIIVNHV
jgi:chemotaxis response regulator CheB